MDKRAKFRELAAGTCFEYERRVYRKLRMNLAEAEDQRWFVFPSEAEVSPVDMDWGRRLNAEMGQVVRLDAALAVPAPERDPEAGAVGVERPRAAGGVTGNQQR
ncbi:MAG TPA: hypothetical protein VNZ64_01785 [Candidatus Acidoferrum sp.]|nr:hypothetical protein [Candidatus Acidoferrum sp.]